MFPLYSTQRVPSIVKYTHFGLPLALLVPSLPSSAFTLVALSLSTYSKVFSSLLKLTIVLLYFAFLAYV